MHIKYAVQVSHKQKILHAWYMHVCRCVKLAVKFCMVYQAQSHTYMYTLSEFANYINK